MKPCGENITKLQKIEQLLRVLTPRFDHIVIEIEECKDPFEINLVELQASLDAFEIKLK